MADEERGDMESWEQQQQQYGNGGMGMSPQGAQGYQGQGYPTQGYPPQGYPAQGYPTQGQANGYGGMTGTPQGTQGMQGMPPQQPSTQSVTLCQDGKYRWAYELGLFSNPTILFLIWKIFAGIGIGLTLFMFILAVFDNGGDVIGTAGDCIEDLPFVLIGFVAMFAITGLGYAVYALMNGGKYCVAFEMDDDGVTHRQMPNQVKKAEVVGMINVLAGIATGNLTQAGIGLTSAQSEMVSSFPAVRSIDGNRGRCVIKVNEPLAKNQVYVEPADYDFVMNYIVGHCPNAKVTNR